MRYAIKLDGDRGVCSDGCFNIIGYIHINKIFKTNSVLPFHKFLEKNTMFVSTLKQGRLFS